MSESQSSAVQAVRPPWWKTIGPALITACVVFGPGSLVISAKVGATYGFDLLWFLVLAALCMGAYMTMSARAGVVSGASHFTTLAREVNRPFAAPVGIVLCLTCAAFQFSNNLAISLVAGAFSEGDSLGVRIGAMAALNVVLIIFLFKARQIFVILERVMKVMVGIVLISFVFNLFKARPNVLEVLSGLIPSIPENLSIGIPKIVDGAISDPLVLIASLAGTTFSVAGAFFQGNLVREKNWGVEDYDRGIGDSIAGVCVLGLVSAMIMVTAGTVIPGNPADNIADLALTLGPTLGKTAFVVFCLGLLPIALNPFLINAMIGGTALADGLGLPGRLHDKWPRVFTVAVLAIGFVMAALGLWTQVSPVNLMVFGQAMTVIGNPLMAGTLLWLVNRQNVMGTRRNGPIGNIIGIAGFLVVQLLAVRVLWFLYLRFSLT